MGHEQLEQLDKKLADARLKIEIGAIYFHYKHPEKYYLIEFVGVIEETEKIGVGYRALYDKGILWIRTLDNFLEEVETDTGKTPRFTKVLLEK